MKKEFHRRSSAMEVSNQFLTHLSLVQTKLSRISSKTSFTIVRPSLSSRNMEEKISSRKRTNWLSLFQRAWLDLNLMRKLLKTSATNCLRSLFLTSWHSGTTSPINKKKAIIILNFIVEASSRPTRRSKNMRKVFNIKWKKMWLKYWL